MRFSRSFGLSALVLVTVGSGCGTSGGENKGPPDWQLVMQDLPGALLRVWGTSSKDVYAVGANGDGKGGLLFHYDGNKWKKIETNQQEDLWWVQGIDGENVSIVGKAGLAMNYNPKTGAMTARHAPESIILFGSWGCAPNDRWYVGGQPAGGHGVVWRDDGTTIRAPEMPATSTKSATIFKVYGFACDDIWMVGQRGLAIHWNGTKFDHPPPDTGAGLPLFTVHGIKRDRIYAVGGASSGVIVAWDGAWWMDETPKPGDGAPFPMMNGVWVANDGTAYTAGFNGHIYKRDPTAPQGTKTAWSELPTNPTGSTLRATFKDYHSIWVDEKNEIWAVGGDLTADPPKGGVLVHYGVPISTQVE
jgi:hypothetical protein